MIESAPVIGVAIKKLCTAPLLAPSFCRDFAKGMTEQEQTGIGMPKIVALITELIFPRPRWLEIKSAGISSLSTPAISSPNKMKRLMLFAKIIIFSINFCISSILSSLYTLVGDSIISLFNLT